MKYMFSLFFFGLLLLQKKHVLGKKTEYDQVWEFGADNPKSYEILELQGLMENWRKGETFSVEVSKCVEIVYNKVELYNPVAKPIVESTLNNVTIFFEEKDFSRSMYKIIFKANRICKNIPLLWG
ncbi:uncharacterized protein LOC106137365 [Amyelois transitella]|uniref:uncharacterized protein LOC106137365 n=1 Tax=Amyelois transitella TaxID=680683 RepID=UPI00067DBDA0|nr:uncharacterized protein LOC106137365 [Amyelois transitella]